MTLTLFTKIKINYLQNQTYNSKTLNIIIKIPLIKWNLLNQN